MRARIKLNLRRLFVVLTLFVSPLLLAQEEISEANEANEVGKSKEKKVKAAKVGRNDYGLKNNDGQAINKKHSIVLHLGPGGVQFGHSNPLGLPPGLSDFEITYLHPTGFEANIGVVPGISVGARYRAGTFLYGSAGTGLFLSAQGLGPGVYTAVGISVVRHWPVTFEAEYKQAAAIGMGMGKTHITTPYAARIGAGVHW